MKPHVTVIYGLLASAAAIGVQAGSLEPPGPPAPTMLPLDQVEARKPLSNADFAILGSGAYYLTEDITAATATGVVIGFGDVTLDLNGYSIVGNGTADVAGLSVASAFNVVVENGTVRGFDTGIAALASTNVDLRRLRVIGNSGDGVRVVASEVSLSHSDVEGNTGSGVTVTGDGFSFFETSLQDNSISSNGMNGVGVDSTALNAQRNRVLLNGSTGIDISMTDAKLIDNTVDLNGGSGIRTGLTTGAILGNRCFNNGLVGGGFGIEVTVADRSLMVAKNLASGNSSGQYDIDVDASAAPQTSLADSPGAWDNIIPTPVTP